MNWTTQDLTQLLRSKYSGPVWAFAAEVPNGTGSDKSRSCDGLAMSLWPSKGLHLHGFEVKVSRSDWLKEIQDVSKAAAFSRYCHYWWIVAPKGVLKIEELPADWGWMQPTDASNLRTKRPATLTQPELPDHVLLAGIFRACLKQSASESAIYAANRTGFAAGQAYTKTCQKHEQTVEVQRAQQELGALKKAIEEFEQASGIKICGYGGKQLGQLVAAVQDVDINRLRQILGRAGNELRRHGDALNATVAALGEAQDEGL